MPRAHTLPRDLHPGAWWVWALGLAAAVMQTTNPLLLGIALGVVTLVVIARRGSSPWARAFRLYLWLGLAIIVLRGVLHILVGLKWGTIPLLSLPTIDLPSWAAGITLLGDVRLEGLLGALLLGARLAVLIACVGAANALANPKRLLRALPGALHEIGSAVVVAVSVAPQLAESVQRVNRARQLRGDTRRGLQAVPAVAMPVLQDTLERSLHLAASMDARGYGRLGEQAAADRGRTSAVTLTGLLVTCLGTYAVLDGTLSPALALSVLLPGLGLCALGLWLGSRGQRRSTYRPIRWAGPEWLTAASGLVAAAGMLAASRTDPAAMAMPLEPLGIPGLPLLAVASLLVGALPAVATPEPARAHRRVIVRRRPAMSTHA